MEVEIKKHFTREREAIYLATLRGESEISVSVVRANHSLSDKLTEICRSLRRRKRLVDRSKIGDYNFPTKISSTKVNSTFE